LAKSEQKKLKILIAASECVPFAKTGGLADVAGALPKALREAGHDVRVVLPKYMCIDNNKFKIKDSGKEVIIDIALVKHTGKILESVIPETDVPVYFIENHEFFDRAELYRTKQGDYWDNAERFMFFSRAIVEMLKVIDFRPDVINCNDWHTGLVPVYLKTIYAWDRNVYGDIATVYSIHNIEYQGGFDKEKINNAGLPMSLFNMNELEFYGKMSFMKGGIIFSDVINTVSDRYKDEIQTPEFSYGLEGVLQTKKEVLYGIVNGIDYSLWDPATDKLISPNYSADTVEKKDEVKKALVEANGLKYMENVPLIGLVSRLDTQKGLDYIAAIIDEIMKMNIQFVVLGTGEEKYEHMFKAMKNKYPEKMGINIKFDNKLAHNIYAGSDMFLMPSHFEPCGLGQLISLKYGTVPIVRETGGLADTIKQFNFKTKHGNGFVFSGNNAFQLLQAIRIAADTYKNKTVWRRLQANGMKENFSWELSAQKYIEIYNVAIQKARKV